MAPFWQNRDFSNLKCEGIKPEAGDEMTKCLWWPRTRYNQAKQGKRSTLDGYKK